MKQETIKRCHIGLLSVAWELARDHVEKYQERQKIFHDMLAQQPDIKVGDRIYLHIIQHAEKQGKAYKFSRSFVGPYCVLTLYPNGVEVKLVAEPVSIRVASPALSQ